MESNNPEGKKRGAWSKEEDMLLKKCIEIYGEGRWHLVPLRAGLNRCRKSCRLRWVNYLCPNIKRGYFTADEVDLLTRLHKLLGNRWSLIAGRIPGRTANDVKNFWNTHIVKISSAPKTSKLVEKTKIVKPKPHKLSKLAMSNNKLQQPFNEEPQKNSQWCSNVLDTAETNEINGISLFSIQKAGGGTIKKSHAGTQTDGGDRVGEDEFGYMLADILRQNNVNNEGMRFDPGARTALAFVTLRNDGEREFMFYRNPSADMLLEVSELDLELIKTAKIFHYGSISLITEPCESAHIAATIATKEAGVILSYDPNLRLPLWPSAESAREGILSIWNIADIIKISEEEICFLTNGEDPYDDNVVSKLYHPNLRLLLVTEGQEGCRYYTKELSGRVEGIKVESVDTTGAGDAFVAGVLSQLAADTSLLQDENRLREALRFANACGALTVTERGAIPALPTRETVLDTLLKSVS